MYIFSWMARSEQAQLWRPLTVHRLQEAHWRLPGDLATRAVTAAPTREGSESIMIYMGDLQTFGGGDSLRVHSFHTPVLP